MESKQIFDHALIIQYDWHKSLKEPISTFFIGIKTEKNSKTIFVDVQATKLIDEFGFTVLPGKDGTDFNKDITNISLDHSKFLHVTYLGVTTVFVSPIKELSIDGLKTAPHTFDVSASGQTFVSADHSGNFVISSAEDGTTLRALQGHTMEVYKCAYFPSGVVVLSGGIDLTIRIWAIDTGECVRVLKGHTQAVTGIGIIGVGKEILSCSSDGSVCKWNCGSKEVIEKCQLEAGKCVELAVHREKFAVISEINLLSIFNCDDLSSRNDIKLPSQPTCLTFEKNDSDLANSIFVGLENGHVAAYSIDDGKLIGEIIADRGRVTCLGYLRGKLLVAYNDGTISVYTIPVLLSSENFGLVSAEFELTGADCDPIYNISIHNEVIYTCCRDKIVRKYKIL